MTVSLSSLREDELDLLRETEPERMGQLDEDGCSSSTHGCDGPGPNT